MVCTMAYQNDYYGPDGKTVRGTRPVEWHFCAFCCLKLRFFDTVKMQANRWIRERIYKDLKPIKVTLWNGNAIAGDAGNMAQGSAADFAALAEGEATVNNMGGPFKKNLASMKDGKWVSDTPRLADFVGRGTGGVIKGRLQGKGAGTGTVKIHFEIDGVKSQNTITITLT